MRAEQDPAGLQHLSWLWTPMVVVTSTHAGRRSGQVALTALGASIVPARPRLSIALWKNNFTHDLVMGSGVCAVHLLRSDQDDLVYRFGLQSGRDVDKFSGLRFEIGETGVPLLLDCLAAFECRTVNHMDGGDHTVFLADVVRPETRGDGSPLWWRELRARMPADKVAAWQAKQAESMRLALEAVDQIKTPD